MTSRPTVLFASFRSEDDPLRRSWTDFRDQLGALAAPIGRLRQEKTLIKRRSGNATIPAEGSGIWRLLAPNNRELARSSYIYSSFTLARDHVVRLHGDASELAVSVVRGPVPGSYGWFLSLNTTPVMMGPRWYERSNTCRSAAQGALLAFQSARIAEAPLRTTPSGRRTRQTTMRELEHAPW